MKKSLMLAPCLVASLICSSCGLFGERHEIKDYVTQMRFHDEFKIAQISDIHISSYDDLDLDLGFVDLVYEDQPDLDLVVLTGDIFTFASKATVRAVLDHFDAKNVPFTLVYGNHDEQTYASYTYASEYATTLKNCKFKYFEDDMTGLSNNIIDLVRNDEVVYELFFVDSNTYSYKYGNGYDYVHEDQIDWYKRAVETANLKKDPTWTVGSENTIPSLLFQHIPLPEMIDAMAAYKEDPTIGTGIAGEASCPPGYNSGFFDVLKAYKSTKAMFFGHDHINTCAIHYEGIDMCYALKSTDNIYYDDDKLGYRLITIQNEYDYHTDLFFHTYDEVTK